MTAVFRNPVFTSSDGSSITGELNHPELGWIPFTACPDDVEAIGRDIYARASMGEFGPVGPYVAPPPILKTRFSVLEFKNRFTHAEQVAIKTATYTDPEVGIIYDNFLAAQFIDLADPRVEQGLDVYVTKGLIAAERKAAILSPETIQL